MDGIENIAYIAIAIGWFLWNTYRKMQANKEQAKSESARPVQQREAKPYVEPEEESYKSLEDMILEQLQGKKKPEPVLVETPKHRNQDKFLSQDLVHSHLPDDYQMSRGEAKSHRVERQIKQVVAVEIEEETIMDRIAPNGFDLKTAIVMDAVLTRPYA